MIPNLLKKGALIRYYDPTGEKKEFSKLKNVTFCSSIPEACLKSDLIIIHTEWNEFKSIEFKKIVKKNKFKIFDLRGIYSKNSMEKNKIAYFCIGFPAGSSIVGKPPHASDLETLRRHMS